MYGGIKRRLQRTSLNGKQSFGLRFHFDDDLHTALRPVLVVAQCFTIMPVRGVYHIDPSQLSFRWFAVRTIYTLLYIFGGFCITYLNLQSIRAVGISARNVVGLIFFSCAVTVGVLFLLMARKWPEFVRKFLSFEAVFLRPPYYLQGFRLRTKLRSAACVILVCAIVEHVLFLSSNIYTIHLRMLYCDLQANSAFVYFAEDVFGFIYRVVPYSPVFFFILEAINVAFTFGWNYIDLFIIMLSITLMTRFGQINARLETVRGKVMSDSYWHEVRSHFVVACELLEFLDRSIGKMIVLSSMNNLYFVCFQLLNIYTKLPHIIGVVYFWFSLGYLMIRTAVVFFAAASIHDSTKRPIEVFRALPTTGWSAEAERFCMQVSNEEIALTGMKFFTLTRRMILGVAAMVVTYELVLLQFDDNALNSKNSTICE